MINHCFYYKICDIYRTCGGLENEYTKNYISYFVLHFLAMSWLARLHQVLFDQVLNLKTNQLYELELEDVQAGDQIWTAVYLVGRQNYPGLTAKVDFVMDNQGLLNKANPSEHAVYQALIAENLTQTNQYSFKQFKGLNTFIEDTSEQLITDPILEKTDSIRIYSQVNDWIPEYNTYEPTKVKFGIQNPLDFDIVAAYVLVGQR